MLLTGKNSSFSLHSASINGAWEDRKLRLLTPALSSFGEERGERFASSVHLNYNGL